MKTPEEFVLEHEDSDIADGQGRDAIAARDADHAAQLAAVRVEELEARRALVALERAVWRKKTAAAVAAAREEGLRFARQAATTPCYYSKGLPISLGHADNCWPCRATAFLVSLAKPARHEEG